VQSELALELDQRPLRLLGAPLERPLEVEGRMTRVFQRPREEPPETQMHFGALLGVDLRCAQDVLEVRARSTVVPFPGRGLRQAQQRPVEARREEQRLPVSKPRGGRPALWEVPPEVTEPHVDLGRSALVAAHLKDLRRAVEAPKGGQHTPRFGLSVGEPGPRVDVLGGQLERALVPADGRLRIMAAP
jgi:hypothetical protein